MKVRLIGLVCLVLLAGCSAPKRQAPASTRHFDFNRDTFAYANELVWEYCYDTNGNWTTHRRQTKPNYYQHCFVVSRSAAQFFENARFDPNLPVADEGRYRHLIRSLVATSLVRPAEPSEKIVFPGYADLRSFSSAQEALLKSECGGAWRCYFQRGNWRMVFPFSRDQQQHVAEMIQETLHQRGAAVVHLVRFPQLTINHAVLIFAADATPTTIEFSTYDPNEPGKPVVITFDRFTGTFQFPANSYFPGGRVDIYPIYDRWIY